MKQTLIAVLLATGLLACGGSAHANLIFTQTPCGGIGEKPCTVVQSHSPAVNAKPLTQEAFNEYYAWDLFGRTATFDYGESGSNADYAFGNVRNSVDAFFDTYYINGPDGLICCSIDEPWRLNGINAGGTLIGDDGAGFPFISTVELAAASGFYAPPVPFTVRGLTFDDLYLVRFLAIDDGGNILAARTWSETTYFELHPAAIPEPGALVLLLGGVLALGAARLRARSR
jgi:hypothetical protein